jgi:uncharacterized membrane protein YfcA
VDAILSSWSLADGIAFLAVGSVAGVLAGLLGVGGGLIIVPALIWVFRGTGVADHVVAHLAVGTSLATIVATSLSSIRAHHARGAVRWPIVARLAGGIVAGTWLGAAVADQLPTAALQRAVGVFALLVAVQMLAGGRAEGHRDLPGTLGMTGAGAVIGAVSGVVGIGGGSLTVPFLTWCRVGMREAVATSAACGFPIALAGTVGFVVTGLDAPDLPPGSTGFVSWPAFAGVALASILTAPVGAHLAHTLPVPVLKRVFAAVLVLVGAKLLLT